MDDYIPQDPFPDHIFETLVEIMRVRSGHEIKVLTAPPSFFDDPDDDQPVVLGMADTVYVLFNEKFIGSCDDDFTAFCTCMTRDIALGLGVRYLLEFQSEMGPPQP